MPDIESDYEAMRSKRTQYHRAGQVFDAVDTLCAIRTAVMGDSGASFDFSCQTCGHDTGWIKDTRTVTENKRGIPCPKCNGGEHG